jgi:modulator of FtsH protease HflK
MASRLMQEAEGYRTRVVESAEGDASRFRQVLTEYQKAPAVTRDRLYIETMQEVYINTTKVLIDSRQGNQLLYLPFDKLMQQAMQDPATARPAPTPPQETTQANELRSRENPLRSRDREAR